MEIVVINQRTFLTSSNYGDVAITYITCYNPMFHHGEMWLPRFAKFVRLQLWGATERYYNMGDPLVVTTILYNTYWKITTSSGKSTIHVFFSKSYVSLPEGR